MRAVAGDGLFTVLAVNGDADHLWRVWSSDPAHYPPGIADRIEDTVWFRRLFTERAPIIANDPETIAVWLPEFGGFAEQGYGALCNMPVVSGGDVVGLMNLMAGAGHFTPGRVAALEALVPQAAEALHQWISDRKSGH